MSDMQNMPFETAYAELETIILQLESGEMPLEQSVTLFERGRKLAAHCQTLLDSAELRVNQLSDGGDLRPLA